VAHAKRYTRHEVAHAKRYTRHEVAHAKPNTRHEVACYALESASMKRSSKREPLWPRERDLDRYNQLAGFDIRKHLDTGGLWIEVGIGKSGRSMRPLIGQPGVELKAIAPHYRALPKDISLTLGCVPDDHGFLAENRGRARLVTDMFGGVSYCEDPLQGLIYGALLLGNGGVFVTFTMLHRMGDLESWDRIAQFFHDRLNQQISFQAVYMLSDASGQFSTYLRIRVEGKAKAKATLSSLFKAAQRTIGVPRRNQSLWTSPDGSAKIFRTDYLMPGSIPPQTR
jgi:hypothetical protein